MVTCMERWRQGPEDRAALGTRLSQFLEKGENEGPQAGAGKQEKEMHVQPPMVGKELGPGNLSD